MKKILVSIKNFFVKLGKTIAKFFANLKNKIVSSKLYTLVVMQLKDKWNFSFKSNKKGAIFKIITYIVIIVGISFVCYYLLNLIVNTLGLFITPFIPITAMNLIVCILLLFEFISILISVTKALYFSKDSLILITYPVKADHVFASKLIVYYIDALKNSFTLLIPVLYGYGILNGLSLGYFFWVIFAVAVIIAAFVVIAGLLSIPTYYVMRFLNKYRCIKILFAFIVLGALAYGIIQFVGIIPENINLIKEYEKFTTDLNAFMNGFKDGFKPSFWITTYLCGESKGFTFATFSIITPIVLVSLFAIIALFLFLDFVISKPFYNKAISSSHDFVNRKHKAKKNRFHSQRLSLFKYETLRIIRDEKMIVTGILAIVVTPLIIFIANSIYDSFETRALGNSLIVFFNYFYIAIMVTSHNVTTSWVYSKDGPSWNINKTIPVNPKTSLFSRLVYNIIISAFIIVPSVVVLSSFGRIETQDAVFMSLLLLVLSTFHIILSASYDFMHSENKIKADIGTEYTHSHEAISLVFALLTSVLSFGLGLLMVVTVTSNVFVRLFVMAVLLLAFEIYMFMKRIKATYQEK